MFNRVLALYTRLFALWVLLGGVTAYFWPEPFIWPAVFQKLFFALTMFGIGAVLRVEDFRRIAQNPVIVLIGSAAQFTIMPFSAFLVSRALGLPDELAMGLILTGSAPGAMSSNVMSYIAKADTAYSVSLTTVSTLLCPILTPGLTFLLAKGTKLDVSFWSMMLDVTLTVVVPLLVGFAVRHYLGRRLEKTLPIFPAISVTFIVFICSGVIASNGHALIAVTGVVLTAVVILNLLGTGAGYGVGTAFRMNVQRRRTLAIEIGMQNAGLGTVLARDYFGDRAAIPAAMFVFICIITASIMTSIWQRRPVTVPAPAAALTS
jgi:BASS family bile acid:Na+ symporter